LRCDQNGDRIGDRGSKQKLVRGARQIGLVGAKRGGRGPPMARFRGNKAKQAWAAVCTAS